jgi:hypothetical protein
VTEVAAIATLASMGLRGLVLACIWLPACAQSAPSVPDPGSGLPPEQVYVDVLLNYSVGTEFDVCRKQLPECDVPLVTPCDESDDMPDVLAVLGAPDDVFYTFGVDGRLDVGIHCGAITEAGPLIIHASAPRLKTANVFVSLDGIYFTMIGQLVARRDDDPDAGPGDDPDAGFGEAADAGVGGDPDPDGAVIRFTGSFSLTTYGFHSIRYVRVFDTGAGGMSIDAIEGTWSGSPL